MHRPHQTYPRIGITLGDPGGIGPEVLAQALTSRKLKKNAEFVLIGAKEAGEPYRIPRRHTRSWMPISPQGKIRIGRSTAVNARVALDSLIKAVEMIKTGEIQSLVTAPVCKESISDLGIPFHGHTEFLAKHFHSKQVEMMFVTDRMKAVILTRHIPLHAVPRAITGPKIQVAIRLTHAALKNFFKINKPHIALCGLNPHAGEGGLLGKEEEKTIIPAILQARRNGFRVSGPFAADTLFTKSIAESFDAIIAMYHDQGLIGVKSLAFHKVVNLTVGLPFIRTSPSHGTAFGIAGKKTACPDSMIAAINLAVHLASK